MSDEENPQGDEAPAEGEPATTTDDVDEEEMGAVTTEDDEEYDDEEEDEEKDEVNPCFLNAVAMIEKQNVIINDLKCKIYRKSKKCPRSACEEKEMQCLKYLLCKETEKMKCMMNDSILHQTTNQGAPWGNIPITTTVQEDKMMGMNPYAPGGYAEPNKTMSNELLKSYNLQDKLAKDNATLECDRFKLQQEVLTRDQQIESLQKKIVCMQSVLAKARDSKYDPCAPSPCPDPCPPPGPPPPCKPPPCGRRPPPCPPCPPALSPPCPRPCPPPPCPPSSSPPCPRPCPPPPCPLPCSSTSNKYQQLSQMQQIAEGDLMITIGPTGFDCSCGGNGGANPCQDNSYGSGQYDQNNQGNYYGSQNGYESQNGYDSVSGYGNGYGNNSSRQNQSPCGQQRPRSPCSPPPCPPPPCPPSPCPPPPCPPQQQPQESQLSPCQRVKRKMNPVEADVEERMNFYKDHTNYLEQKVNQMACAMNRLQLELCSVQKERKELDQYRNGNNSSTCGNSCKGPCAKCGVCPGSGAYDDNGGDGICPNEELDEIKRNYASLLCEFSRKEQEICDLKDQMSKMCSCEPKENPEKVELDIVKRRLKDMQEEQEEFKLLVKEQSEQLDDYRNKYMCAQQTCEEQKCQMENMEMNNRRIEDQINLEIQRIKCKFQEKLRELAPLPKLLENEQIKNCELQKEVEDLEEKLCIVCTELKDAKKQLDDLRSSNDSSMWEKKYIRVCEELCTLRKCYEKINCEKQCLETRLSQVQEELDCLRTESAKIIARNKERAECQRECMQMQIDKLEIDLAQCRAAAQLSLGDREEAIKQMQSQLNVLSCSFDEAQMQIRSLKNHITFLSNENPPCRPPSTNEDSCTCIN